MTARPQLNRDPEPVASVEPMPRAERASEGAADESERERMIALAAYYRAEKRGFAPGAEMEDWLAAEREIEALVREAT